MTSDFYRVPPHLAKPASHTNLTSIQNHPSSLNPSYSVYEKALGKELLPAHNSNSSAEFSHRVQAKNNVSKYPPHDPNMVSGVGSFGSLLSNVYIKHDTSPYLLLDDVTTDKQGLERGSNVVSQRASENYYMSKPRETKGRSSVMTNLSTNISNNGAVRQENGVNITAWLESYGTKSPFNSGNVGLYDESSTKDNSVIENNLASNHMFLKNLENLTTILGEPHKANGMIVQTKYRNVENKSVGRKGVNSSMIQMDMSGKNENVNVSSYSQIYETSTQVSKGRSASALQTRREDPRQSHQLTQTQREKSLNDVSSRQEDERSGYARGPHSESYIIQQKDEEISSNSSKGNLQRGQIQAPSKSLAMQKMLKNTLDSSYVNQSRGSMKHNSVNMGYNASTNRLNYGQIRLLGEPIEDSLGSQSRRKENSGYLKPYWQLKKTAEKLEASKKSLVNSLMKNNYVNVSSYNIRGPYGIEGNSKQAVKGSQLQKKSSGSSVREGQGNSGDSVRMRNLEKKTSGSRPGSAMGNVGNEVRNGVRKDGKPVDMKRSLSGKLNVKGGDEHGKENSLQRNVRNEHVGGNNGNKQGNVTQSVHRFDANRNNISHSRIDKETPAKERTQYTIEESSQKGENTENPKFIPQLFRGRTMMKYKEYPDDDFSPVSFDTKNQAVSKSFTSYSKPEQMRPLSESRSSSKDILTSLKDFSYGFVKSTKEFFQHKYSNQKPRTKCRCMGLMHSDNESCPKAQKWILSKYKESELDYLKKMYEKIRDSPDIDPRCRKQIGLDIKRTYPECEFFASNSEGLLSLERVLQCYAKYDPKIGYVQGMNFIAASILYHAEEYIAFWILILTFEKSEMRDVYMQDLPGLAKHSQIVDFLILNNLGELYSHFCKHNITVDMFCTEWIFGLFGSVIPVEKMDCFLDGFVDEGWLFFYKFVLALLKSFERELLEASDMSEILTIFKSGINKRERTVFNGTKERVDWEKLVRYANQIELDSSFIHKMLMVFDQETKRFLLNSK